MSTPPSGSDPLPDDDDLENFDEPDLDDIGDENVSGDAASDPETARQEAEDALAEIEALADLDEDPDPDRADDSGAESASSTASAESSPSDDGPREDQCENCGALLDGPYCSQCGQKAADRIVPIWHMINEALESLFQLDLRVLHTLPKFLFLPGRLTKEYINGRRTRYIRPFRLYLFSTFLLFAALALTTTGNFGFFLNPQGMTGFDPPNTDIRIGASPNTSESASATADSPAPARASATPLDSAVADTEASADSGSTATRDASMFGTPEERKKVANRIRTDTSAVQLNVDVYNDPAANERLESLLRQKTAHAIENPWEAVSSMIDRGPYLMFLMLPIFAFLLKLLYIRRGRLYVEHLVFSLHVHALAFFAFTVGILLSESDLGWLNAVAPWIDASPLVYLILAMSHVYDQGFIKSTLKALILLLIYAVVLSFGFVLLLFVAVLLM